MLSTTRQLCFIAMLCAFMLSGCAIMKKDNRILLNAMDRSLKGSFITSTTASRIAFSPLIVPTAIGAGAIDAAIITPVRAIAPAAEDTDHFLWENPQGSDMRKAMLFLPKSIATPIVFIGCWSGRSIFPSDI